MVYTIVFWSDTGNWSSRTSTPDPLVLLAIKQSLEDIVRPKCVLEQLPASTCDVTPLAYLVWRTKYRSNATVAVMEGSVYTELADFINNLAVPGVQQEQQAVPTRFSFNLQ